MSRSYDTTLDIFLKECHIDDIEYLLSMSRHSYFSSACSHCKRSDAFRKRMPIALANCHRLKMKYW